MATVAETGEELYVETGYAPLSVDVVGWEPSDGFDSLGRPVDEAVCGRTERLRVPTGTVRVERPDGSPVCELESESASLEAGDYLVTVRSSILVFVRFEGAATVSLDDEWTTLSFPEPTRVTMGFRAVVEDPPGALVVPETAAGVATALTYAAASHRTTTADRSLPAMRRYPPLVEFGDLRVPDAVEAARPPTDLTVVVPPDPELLFLAASPAYYLGAEVTTVAGATPRLEAADWTREFSTAPSAFESSMAAVLRRAFRFDCLVRGAGPRSSPLPSVSALERLGVDPADLYDATPADRLAVALDVPFEEAVDVPPWHLSVSIEPTVGNAVALPHLLRDVPVVRRPVSEPLATRERLSRSLDDFFRSGADVPVIDLVEAESGPGATHGWLAPGVPIDVYKTDVTAYQHRFAGRDRRDGPPTVDVVCNDAAMEDAFEAVVDVYRGAEDVVVTVRRNLRTAGLAAVFEAETDFVHFVGHCDEEGLRCANGALSTSSLDDVGARAFFLNACGSYYEGQELVRRGSVAGAVTLEAVLDAPARRVSRVFTRLLVAGFDVQRALQLARRRIVMSKDYTVVGDGTHTLSGSKASLPDETRVESLGGGTYRVEHVVRSPRTPGGQHRSPFDGRTCLVGTRREATVDADELRSFLAGRTFPVIFEGDVWSPEAVVDRIADEP